MLLQKVFLRLRVNILYPRHVRVERPGNGRGKILSVIAMIFSDRSRPAGSFGPPPFFWTFHPDCLHAWRQWASFFLGYYILHLYQILELMSKCQGEENTPSFIN